MTREDIRRIPELNNKILRDEAHLRYLKERATAIPALSAKERVKTSNNYDQMKYIVAAADLEEDLSIRKRELKRLKKEAAEWIKGLDTPLDKRIFRLRLIKCFTWDEITDLIGYSRRRTFQIIERVLSEKTD